MWVFPLFQARTMASIENIHSTPHFIFKRSPNSEIFLNKRGWKFRLLVSSKYDIVYTNLIDFLHYSIIVFVNTARNVKNILLKWTINYKKFIKQKQQNKIPKSKSKIALRFLFVLRNRWKSRKKKPNTFSTKLASAIFQTHKTDFR